MITENVKNLLAHNPSESIHNPIVCFFRNIAYGSNMN